MIITKELLDSTLKDFDVELFIMNDPCGIIHKLKERTDNQLDIEIGALLTAMISWGSRKVIIPTAEFMIGHEMNWRPAEFILTQAYEDSYRNAKNNCVYRTLNVDTFKQVCKNLHDAVKGYDNMEMIFEGKSTKEVISIICEWLSPAKIGTIDKSACKRICMFLRWMTRSSLPDFNLWKTRNENDLYAIMDVHVSNLTKDLLHNKRPSWKACEELTSIFKSWDVTDPLRYDIALMVLADKINKTYK